MEHLEGLDVGELAGLGADAVQLVEPLLRLTLLHHTTQQACEE